MNAKYVATAFGALSLLTGLVATSARAEDAPEPAAASKLPENDYTRPVTDTPPTDIGPWTNSIRRPPYVNLLGDRVIIPALDNGLGHSALSISGFFWEDIGYMQTDNEQPGKPNQKATYMQGRLVSRLEYQRTLTSDFFAAARAEVIAFENEFTQSQYEPHTLEAWVKAGGKFWDVQIGRFYPFLVYYRGLGVDLYTPEESGAAGTVPTVYFVNWAWGLQDEPGQFALHLFPIDGLGIEVSGIYGQTSNLDTFALRPVVDWKLGGLEIVAGGEYYRQVPQRSDLKTERTYLGGGGRVQYTLPIRTAGVEAAYTHSDLINANEQKNGAETFDRYSVGGWIDVYLFNDVFSVGLHHTADSRLNNDKPTQDQGYVAFLHRLPVNGLSVKFVYGMGRGHVDDATADAQFLNTEQAFRVRVQYLFQ